MRKEYIDKMVKMMADTEFSAMLICPSEEMDFFIGYVPMMCERFQGLFIKKTGEMFYICNLLYGEEVKKGFEGAVPVYTWFDGDVMTEVVGNILKEQGLEGAVIGVNSSAQAFNVLELMDKINVTFKNGKPFLEEIRVTKTPEEMECLRQAAKIADDTFAAVIKKIKPGLKEAQVRDWLTEEMTSRGGSDFDVIVASGPNSSYPHYSEFDRVIEEQDIIILDFGCGYKGLRSDISRTVFVGGITDEQKKVYEIIDRAQMKAQNTAVLGAFIPDIDAAARDIIAEEGYDGTLVNRVGHGIGFMTHEAPDIKKSNPRRLEKGMAFSIEPGIYMGGYFGLRIENILLVNDKGETEVLNQASRDIIIL